MKLSRNPKIRYQLNIGLSSFSCVREAISHFSNDVEGIHPIAVLSHMGVLYELNLSAALFWEIIEVPKEINEITLEMLKYFNVSEAELNGDISRLANDLQDAGVIYASD